ncbi:MAG: hypothetical protein ACOYKJ_02835 [Candidatus Howiella sp.]|jgi:hypothetical protein
MHMIAVVQKVRAGSLLVRNTADLQEVVANTNDTRCFRVGDVVSILYSGAMTMSIPPQISVIRIRRIFPQQSCR